MSRRVIAPLPLIATFAAMVPLIAVDDASQPAIPKNPNDRNATSESKNLHSWELPALVVQGKAGAELRDEDLIGAYEQPRWTAARRFAEVRTYVIPEGQFEFEYWLFVTTPSRHARDDAAAAGLPKPKPEIKQLYEAELGLGHRLQLDLYQVYVKDGSNGANALDATKFELRYALADWGALWANPTFYGEWTQAALGADSGEVKLLLCDSLTERWAWASNLVFEEKTGDNRERSHEWNSALSYDAIDRKFSLGAELAIAYVNERDPNPLGGFLESRSHHWEIAAGPSIRFNPLPQAHVILAEFIGINRDAPESKTALIVGWEF